ncbi:hypothetical protein D9757_011732 [Collybiopsis confluens]|uniref:Uncharacterized protein n=1 Tax=Collybiopsis confluens TaxID=2823264 RepID=A0A8H5LK79_9AGAR|nr:hypothetical protein D9757_011732 [Collybiopsis confluens]
MRVHSLQQQDSLQKAIDDFQERIAPAFVKFEAQTKELEKLRKELLGVRGKADGFDVMCNESRKKDRQLAELYLKLERSEKDGRKALSLAERCGAEIIELKGQIEIERLEREKLETDNRSIRGMLDRQSKAVTLYKRKAKEYKETISELTKQNETLIEQSQLEGAASSDKYDQSDYENSASFLPLVHSLSSPERPHRPHRSSGLSQITNEIHLGPEEVDFTDGMPGPGFSSDWMMHINPQKRKATSVNFPIPLDKRGRPTVSVQTGPVRSRRIPAM